MVCWRVYGGSRYPWSSSFRSVTAGMRKAAAQGTKSGNPIGRPRVDAETERAIQRLLRDGTGINKTAATVGVGTATVQRVRAEMSPFDGCAAARGGGLVVDRDGPSCGALHHRDWQARGSNLGRGSFARGPGASLLAGSIRRGLPIGRVVLLLVDRCDENRALLIGLDRETCSAEPNRSPELRSRKACSTCSPP